MVDFNCSSMKINIIIFILLLEFTTSSSFATTSEYISSSKLKANSKSKLKILALFHHPGKSHFDFFKPLLERLAQRGHKMTVVSYFPRNGNVTNQEILPNYKDICLSGTMDKWVNVIDLTKLDHSIFRCVKTMFTIREWGLDACKAGLKIPEVRQLIKSDEKFDLILFETFNTYCFLGFVHKFKAPFISLSSHEIMPWVHNQIGSPDNPSYVPNHFLGLSLQKSFLDRVINSIMTGFANFVFEMIYQWPSQKIVEEVFGPGVPPLSEIAKTTCAVLSNTHYSLFGSRPKVPNEVDIGGLHIRSVKPLPDDLKKFLDEASEGVLLFSWGSMIQSSSLPKEKLEAILGVFGSIPRKVIWKWEIEELPEQPSNLMILKWLPQFDILSEYK